MNPPMIASDIAKRCRMVVRAFTWDKPLPVGFHERMRRFDSGEDRSEEMWYGPYRLTPLEEDEEPETLMTWKGTRRVKEEVT